MPRAPRRGASTRRQPLTRERIADAAIELIEREGLDEFSTRKLGAELGCEAMSIYHHFPSKGDLLDAIASRLLGKVDLSSAAEEGVVPELRLVRVIRSYREVARTHPRSFPLLALRRLNSVEAMTFLEAFFGILRDAGFDPERSTDVFRLLGHWATGAALSELAARSQVAHPTRTVPASEVDPDRYPLTREATPWLLASHFDATFEFGLRSVLDAVRRARGK
jgi:AcrR family transcriptional regulator